MATSPNDFTADQIRATAWVVLLPANCAEDLLAPLHERTGWARVELRPGCYATRATDAATLPGAWDYAGIYQEGAAGRRATLHVSARRYTDFRTLCAQGRLLAAGEYERRRQRAVSLHKRFAEAGCTDHYARASTLAGRPIESFIQHTEPEHEAARAWALACAPAVGGDSVPAGSPGAEVYEEEGRLKLDLYSERS